MTRKVGMVLMMSCACACWAAAILVASRGRFIHATLLAVLGFADFCMWGIWKGI